MIDLQPKPEGLEFRLTRGRDITCRVINRLGEPIAGGWTVVEPFPDDVRYGVWLKDTDEHGEFHVPHVPQKNVRLTVGKEGYITVRDYVVTPSECKVVITMQNAVSLSGTVTDAETGKPIPHFEIKVVGKRIHSGNQVAFTQGTYDLNIDEMRHESLQLRVFAAGYGMARSEDIRIDEGSRVIDFKLIKDPLFDTKGDRREYGQARPTGTRTIKGVVRVKYGRPVSGAIVTTYPMLSEETITDAEGAFTLELKTFDSMMGGMGGSFAKKKASTLLVRHKKHNLAAAVKLDDDTETVEIALTPGKILSGRVVDVEGNPVSGTELLLAFFETDSGSGYTNPEVTEIDDEGNYQIRAVPLGHRYYVIATAEGYGQPYTEVFTYEDGRIRKDLEPLVLEVANLSVSGVVVDSDGKPVASAKVNASGQGQPNRFDILTDLQGRFKIEGVCAGSIRLWVNGGRRDQLYGSAETEGGATDVEIVALPRGINRRSKPTR